MLAAVIPVCNEAAALDSVLYNLRRLSSLTCAYFILNGCTDDSEAVIRKARVNFHKHLICYPQKLGVDIPRAVGAYYALKKPAQGVLFLDGDVADDIHRNLKQLTDAVLLEQTDLALTNCYQYPVKRFAPATEVLKARGELNSTLGLFHELGLASPSHGPLCASARIIRRCGLTSLAIPPLFLARVRQCGGKIKVASALGGRKWYGSPRSDEHNRLIAETIIGDCKAAENYYLRRRLDREGHDGCHSQRDFPTLAELTGENMPADL